MKSVIIFLLCLALQLATRVSALEVYLEKLGNSSRYNVIEKISFVRFGDHLFGYAQIWGDVQNKNFLRITISNGTRSKSNISAVVKCIVPNGKAEQSFVFSRVLGFSSHGSIERSIDLDFRQCNLNSRLSIEWFKESLDFVNLEELSRMGKEPFVRIASEKSISEMLSAKDRYNKN